MTENSGTQGLLVPGSTIGGYVIEQQVGQGGMAVVYRARDNVLGRLVAVKVLTPALAANEEFRSRFLRESRAVAAVDEPHIVPVYAAGEADGVLYIATRFVADGDLGALQTAVGGPLPPAQAVEIVAQVAGALDAAHAVGLVHRDVKPGNILVERLPGRPEHAYLSDFGLSKFTAAGSTGLTGTGRFMGTPDFCAPEQVTGGAVDGRTDQYSLACVAFALLTGTVPFGQGDAMVRLYAHVNSPVPALTALRPGLPAAVDQVLVRGLAKQPAYRYGSCAEFAMALRDALGLGMSASSRSVPPSGPLGVPSDPGYQPTVAAGWQPPPGAPGGTLPLDNGGTMTIGAGSGVGSGQAWQGPGQAWQQGPGTMPQGPGQAWPQGPGMPSGPGQAWPQGPGTMPPQGPGQWQRPPRRNTGLIVGGSVAGAVVLVVGLIVGIGLTGNHGTANPGPTPTTTTPTGSASASSGSGSVPSVTATLAGTLTGPGPMNYAFFSPDGKYIAADSTTSDVYVWSAVTLKLVNTVSVAKGDTVTPIGFSPDDTVLYAVDRKTNDLYDLDIATGKALNIFAPPTKESLGFEVSFGSSVIDYLDSAANGTVNEFEVATGKRYATVENPGTSAMAGVRSSADGSHVLISDKNGKAYLMDAQSDTVIGTFSYAYSSATGVPVPALSGDGSVVYLPGGTTAPAKIWDAATKDYNTPTDPAWPLPDNGITFSTDSKFEMTSPSMVSVTEDIWSTATRAHVLELTVPDGADQNIESLGPGASELVTTKGFNQSAGTFPTLELWAIPGS